MTDTIYHSYADGGTLTGTEIVGPIFKGGTDNTTTTAKIAALWSLSVGTTIGTIAAGNDARILGAEQAANKGIASGYAGLDGSSRVAWANLPAAAQSVPIAFIIPGLPAASQIYNLAIAIAMVIPANFVGTVVYDDTLTTSSAVFTLKKISGGATTTIGTVTITTANHTSKTLSTQAQASLAVGDVLQLVCPSSQDATLADVGITILANKV